MPDAGTSRSARHCKVCHIDEDNDEDFGYHILSEEHRTNYALFEYNNRKESICKDRHGVSVTVQVKPRNNVSYNFKGEPDKEGSYTLTMTPEEMQKHDNTVEFLVNIKNVRNESSILLTGQRILHPYDVFSLHDPNNNLGKLLELKAGSSYQLVVKFHTKQSTGSRYKIPLSLTFQPVNVSQTGAVKSFSIVRAIIVGIHYTYEKEEDIGKSPFTHVAWEIDRNDLKIIRPVKNYRPFTDQYRIPKNYWQVLKSGLKESSDNIEVLQEIRNMIEPERVTQHNYVGFFSIMLWLEEVACVLGLSSYNMENVTLLYRKPYLVLEVPGLAEKRPSVIVGDMIELRVHDDHTIYQGVIKNVTDGTVEIADVHPHCIEQVKENMEMDVRFILSRVSFERMHQGIRMVENNELKANLFPDESRAQMRIVESFNLSESAFLNKDIYRNNEQRTAVLKILNNTSKNVPYIVYGPPGTGKTMTIVEAIMQIKIHTKKRIIVCAPANAACNMILQRLAKHCTTKELKRVMSINAETDSIQNEYMKYTNVDIDQEGGRTVTPVPAEKLKQFRIIVTTLILAGKYTGQYRPDVVFIDEAAQAREPESACAIGLLSTSGQVVLAGDPQQLGPSVSSKICQKYLYDVSILERLWKLPLYQNDTRDMKNNFITMLKLNFRSHPGILELPNELFYENELQAMSLRAKSDPLATILLHSLLKKKNSATLQNGQDYSLEFSAILSKERREGRSPSYFNPNEVQMVVKYVEALTSLSGDLDGTLPVKPCDIGVVTPYIRQVYKVREALRSKYEDIEVGTTEAFQGREKRVMIISTVRAQEDLMLYDKRYKLGFVSNVKRFNVAITRAKSKLIVIGNPQCLVTDKNWTKMMQMCSRKGTYSGPDFRKLKRTPEIRKEIGNRISDVQLPESNKEKTDKKKATSRRG